MAEILLIDDREFRTPRYTEESIRVAGGPGSGNFGHGGRPGQVGGSSSDVPDAPGTAAIPAGMTRRFHVTMATNLESIREHGLTTKFAKGIEGPKAVYSFTNFADAKQYASVDWEPGHAVVVEHYVPEGSFEANPYATHAEVTPSQIVGIHQSWHDHYRYALENGLTPEELRGISPEYDKAADALAKKLRSARRPENAIHVAADAHVDVVRAAVVRAFHAGQGALNVPLLRSAIKSGNPKRARSAVAAVHGVVRSSLARSLPSVLAKALHAGGRAGMTILKSQVRAAGGPGSGNFGHSGRPGEVGGSGEGTALDRSAVDDLLTEHNPEDYPAFFRKHHIPVRGTVTSLDKNYTAYMVELKPDQQGRKLFIVEDGDTTPVDAHEWVSREDPTNYIEEPDFNKEFWESPGSLFHRTTEDHVESIEANGLEARSETRGLTNRGTGPAVFTSNDPENNSEYGDVVYEIDMAAMKRDGYTPEVSSEIAASENQLRSALAWKIGLHDYDTQDYDDPGAADENTTVIHGHVPRQYIKALTAHRVPIVPVESIPYEGQIFVFDHIPAKYLTRVRTRAAGGPGSGNFGHAGRPGEVGGSSSGGPSTKEKKGTIHNIVNSMKAADEQAVFGTQGSVNEIVEHIADAVPGEFTVQLKSGKDVDGHPYVRSVMLANNNATVVNTYHRHKDGTLEVHHDLLELPRGVQGQGVGKELLRQELEDYQRIGVDQVSLLANIDVGGYAWAKYGFTLDPDMDAYRLRAALETNMEKKDVDDVLRRRVRGIIDQHIVDDEENLDPRVIWKIADLTGPNGEKQGADVLLGADWDGVLNLKDPETMARVKKYLG